MAPPNVIPLRGDPEAGGKCLRLAPIEIAGGDDPSLGYAWPRRHLDRRKIPVPITAPASVRSISPATRSTRSSPRP